MTGPRGGEDRRSPASRCSREQLRRRPRHRLDRRASSHERIGEYDGILIRSATQVDADLHRKATNLRAIGRAGVGVDNVDVPAATKRGIIVANAPQSNVVTAAEHTLALLLALARNVPQAHSSLVAGAVGALEVLGHRTRWTRRSAILGFGRIGQLVAHARAGLRHARDRLRPVRRRASATGRSGVDKAETSDDVYAVADFITVHLPKTPETEDWLDAEAFSKMQRRGARSSTSPAAR